MLAEEVIIVGKELLPSMIAGADMAHIKGLVSESGGVTSHIAIMSRNMEIPAVFGIRGIMDKIEDGRLLAIDGSKGIVQFDVDAELLADIGKQLYEQKIQIEMLRKPAGVKAATKDGHMVELGANIGNPEDVPKALENGAEGIEDRRTVPE